LEISFALTREPGKKIPPFLFPPLAFFRFWSSSVEVIVPQPLVFLDLSCLADVLAPHTASRSCYFHPCHFQIKTLSPERSVSIEFLFPQDLFLLLRPVSDLAGPSRLFPFPSTVARSDRARLLSLS